MKIKFRKHFYDYLVLLLGVFLAVAFTVVNSNNKTIVYFSTIGLSIFYFFWGIIHHLGEGSLRPKVALEYLLFSVLGCLIVIGLV